MGVGVWDTDPWLLNTPAGVVDLRTGQVKGCDREDRMTRITAVGPDFVGECGLWRGFLRRITAGDGDVEEYLARVLGYCLTGVTVEHALFFLHGTGRNGKGTCAHTARAIMGDYATGAESQTFAASRGERHLTELARLDGARLVVTSETEEGRSWNESRIKGLTGGDPITANFMRQDHFTFTPKFKLLMLGNHKPRLHGVDEAMRARINLIPFMVFLPPAERDKDLMDRMVEREGGAILAWAVRGCLAWQRCGLAPPRAVVAATDDYMSAEDSRTIWFREACRDCRGMGAGAGMGAGEPVVESRVAELFQSWRGWAERAGEEAKTQTVLVEWLRQQGFTVGTNMLCQQIAKGVRTLTFGEVNAKQESTKSAFAVIPGGKPPI